MLGRLRYFLLEIFSNFDACLIFWKNIFILFWSPNSADFRHLFSPNATNFPPIFRQISANFFASLQVTPAIDDAPGRRQRQVLRKRAGSHLVSANGGDVMNPGGSCFEKVRCKSAVPAFSLCLSVCVSLVYCGFSLIFCVFSDFCVFL